MDARGSLWERRARRWLDEPLLQLGTSAGLFLVVAVASTSSLYANWSAAGVHVSYIGMLTVRTVDWLLWAMVVPIIVRLDRGLRQKERTWVSLGLIHLLLATVWFSLQNAVPALLTPWLNAEAADTPFWAIYVSRGVVRLSTAWVVYAFILGTTWLLQDFVRRQSLERDLYDAQLRALRGQIQPHFLFNTLHTVGALVRGGDREEAIHTLVALSDLLRRSLNHTGHDEVPLEEELDFLDTYLAIQRARFGANLSVESTVDPSALSALVPPLVLQPLVENAIQHGLDLDREPGVVRISITGSGDTLSVRVEDEGGTAVHDAEPPPEGGGIGLSNLRSRLERLYGSAQELRFQSTPDGGTVVTIIIPRRKA